MADANQAGTGRWIPVLLMFAALVAIVLYPLQFLRIWWWGWLLATLPPLLVFHHAIYLYLVRNPFASRRPQEPKGAGKPGNGAADHRKRALHHASVETRKLFSGPMLALRFGLPALLMFAVCLVILDSLFATRESFQWPPPGEPGWGYLKAARYGAAGAYVFVLLNLGQRNFRNDITNGTAIWCTVTLALGPVLAWALAHFWTPAPATAGAGAALGPDSVFFLAGLSARFVASAVEEGAKRILAGSSDEPQKQSLQPLSPITGMTRDVRSRLEEEGIADITSLAMANPLRLLRSTSYELKEILCWVDEALLVYYAPASWEKIRAQNLVGAIDVAALALEYPASGPGKGKADPGHVEIKRIAEATGMSADALVGLVYRLYLDSQVELVWALYEFGEDDETQDGAPEQEAQEAAPQAGWEAPITTH